jgi:flavodoxin
MAYRPDRRTLLGAAFAGPYALALLTACAREAPETETSPAPARSGTGSGILVAYFSRPGENYHYGDRIDLQVGNTETVASLIAERLDCDTYRIEAADPYPEDYDDTVARNTAEQDTDARPALAGDLPDMSAYNTILLGSPIWNVRAPMIMSTFTEALDLTGKTLYPFVTYAVSGLAGVDDDYRTALPDTVIGTALAVQGETAADAGPDIDQWLRDTDLKE